MSRDKRSNGEGHFTELPDGRCRLTWMQGYNADGRPHRLTVTGKSKSECIKLKKAREDSLPKSGSTAFEKVTFLKLCELHLAEDLSHKDKLKPTAADRRDVTINNQI